MRAVLRNERDADVPCDGCVGCCVSGYPIPLRPDDRRALDEVPAQWLKLPVGTGLARMLPRADGTCPMMLGRRCTIYADRPRTCRDYDCRIYAACGVMPDGERPVIQQRVAEWKFSFGSEQERADAEALRRATAFIRAHAALFPGPMHAESATAAVVLAVKVFPLFRRAEGGPPAERVRQVIEAAKAFDLRRLPVGGGGA